MISQLKRVLNVILVRVLSSAWLIYLFYILIQYLLIHILSGTLFSFKYSQVIEINIIKEYEKKTTFYYIVAEFAAYLAAISIWMDVIIILHYNVAEYCFT